MRLGRAKDRCVRMLHPDAELFVVSDSAFSLELADEVSEAARLRVAALVGRLDRAAGAEGAVAAGATRGDRGSGSAVDAGGTSGTDRNGDGGAGDAGDSTLLPRVLEIVPSYRAVLVEYDPLVVDGEHLAGLLLCLAAGLEAASVAGGRTVEVPVCYGGQFGPDLAGLAAERGLTESEAVRLHATGEYPVYMLGFTPGFSYLGGLDERLASPRLAVPRTLVPAGSVGIAGRQTGVYPQATPGGWRLIGRTPLKLFEKSRSQPFWLAAGDIVRFVAIDEATYWRLAEEGGGAAGKTANGEKSVSAGTPPGAVGGAEAGHSAPPTLAVVEKGMLTTVQDLGRRGYQRFGVPVSGAMDWYAASLANLLVGNAANAPLLESTVRGPVIDILADCWLALTGIGFSPRLSGTPVALDSCLFAPAGSRLVVGTTNQGARCYLAFAGGLDVAPDLGSTSTYIRAGLGGLDGQGRPLQSGDQLWVRTLEDGTACTAAATEAKAEAAAAAGEPGHRLRYRYSSSPTLRIVTEARPCYFADQAVDTLTSNTYTVTANSDRMGYRLQGPAIPYAPGCDGNAISDGTACGSIQIVGGQPVILLADRQTIGGYPKIGAVITADLPQLAQLKPGDTLRFTEVTLATAQTAYRTLHQQLDYLQGRR